MKTDIKYLKGFSSRSLASLSAQRQNEFRSAEFVLHSMEICQLVL